MENQKGFKNLLDKSITTREVIFLLAVVFCLSPLMVLHRFTVFTYGFNIIAQFI